ncbi:MAG: hypothetical protein R3Y06_06245, partial [Faecalibacterium sp.]
PEGATEGEMPEGMTEGGMSERTEMSGDSAAVSEGNSAMGGDSAAMSEGTSSMGGMSEMGGMGEMSGGMSGGMDSGTTVDYSSMITLSDETQLYIIPSGTTVEYYGFEMTFSQIETEQYITITISEDGKILYVEVLG